MNKIETITIEEYLEKKGIKYWDHGEEISFHCPFNPDCDGDSQGSESHCNANKKTGQYHCKKCLEKGNLFTLAKHNGDTVSDIALESSVKKQKEDTKELEEKVHNSHTTLLDSEELLNHLQKERGLSKEIIVKNKIGYGKFYNRLFFTIPVYDEKNVLKFIKLHHGPHDNTKPKSMVYPKGKSAEIYGYDILKSNETIMISEGEFDCLASRQAGIPTVTSTAGCTTFREVWAMHFKHVKSLYLCYDNDTEGKRGAQMVAEILSKIEGLEVTIITLPDMGEDRKDLTDYFVHYQGTMEDLFQKYSKKFISAKGKKERIFKFEKPEVEITIEEWRKVIKENFPDLAFAAEIILAIFVQILIKDITNCFALVLEDKPSSGKTILINIFCYIQELIHESDKFTPASFVSNATNVKKEKLAEIDLLPKLQFKVLGVRDLATLFSKREEDLKELLGILTRVLDGEGLATDTGVHGSRQYKGEYLFMMIAASTPVPSRVWKIMGNLGSRLFFLKLNLPDKTEDELAQQLRNKSYKEKEKICQTITSQLIKTLWYKHAEGIEWDKTKDSHDETVIISRSAILLSKLRGVINDGDDEFENSVRSVLIEKPDRLNQLLYNLARGHAVCEGRIQINQSDLKYVIELVIDSAPFKRSMLFRNLLENGGAVTTTKVEEILKVSKTTAIKEMERLETLGICDMDGVTNGEAGRPPTEISLCEEFSWFVSKECRQIRGLPPIKNESSENELEDINI
jgi:hypothetical protein